MGMLNNLWQTLTNENLELAHFICLPLVFVEAYVHMIMFTTILNIQSNRKQKIIYILFSSILGLLCSLCIPKPYSNIATTILIPLAIMFIFKVSFIKGLLSETLILFCVTIAELGITRLFLLLFNCTYEMCANIPIYRVSSTLLIYFAIFAIAEIAKYYKANINGIETLSKKNKSLIIVNTIFALVVIFMQMYLIVFYYDTLPLFAIIINILCLFSYFLLSIHSLVKTMKLEKTTADLEQEKSYNKTLQILHDNIRAFKHDFSNIIAGIGGYVETKDIDGLSKYYKQLLKDCGQVNNLSSLNPGTINNPAVYSVLANKYYKADNLGITINLESFINFDDLHLPIYEFTRMLGILMDNAIEATTECNNKLINVVIRNDARQNRQLLTIENTYENKDVNIDKIYEKGYSTKPNNTGLGLWEIDRIIKKHKNITRFTRKTDEFFIQQIEIYNE